MKKRIFGRKFSRTKRGRQALLVSLARQFINEEKITTTQARASTLSLLIDKLVSRAKKNNLAATRSLVAFFKNDARTTRKLNEEVSLRFDSLSSGFTRKTRIGSRVGDNAPMVKVMWSREREEDIKKQDDSEKSKKQKK